MTYPNTLLLILVLSGARLMAGEASGGGTPEASLVDWQDVVLVGAPLGRETTTIHATVFAKSLTAEAVTKRVSFEFLKDQVHFFSKAGAPADADVIHLHVNREPNDGVFSGTLSLGTKSMNVSCSRL